MYIYEKSLNGPSTYYIDAWLSLATPLDHMHSDATGKKVGRKEKNENLKIIFFPADFNLIWFTERNFM